jgi:hypothetical protein
MAVSTNDAHDLELMVLALGFSRSPLAGFISSLASNISTLTGIGSAGTVINSNAAGASITLQLATNAAGNAGNVTVVGGTGANIANATGSSIAQFGGAAGGSTSFGGTISFAPGVNAINKSNSGSIVFVTDTSTTNGIAGFPASGLGCLLMGNTVAATGATSIPGIRFFPNFATDFYGIGKQTVTGAKGGNAALGSLLAALGASGYNLITDSTTA